MSAPDLFDPGLQPERTQLSWRRTALSIAVGSLVTMRLLPEALGGPAWVVPGIAGVLFAGWLWAVAGRRYARFNAHLGSHPEPAVGGAAALLVLMLFACVGAGGLSIVIVLLLQR